MNTMYQLKLTENVRAILQSIDGLASSDLEDLKWMIAHTTFSGEDHTLRYVVNTEEEKYSDQSSIDDEIPSLESEEVYDVNERLDEALADDSNDITVSIRNENEMMLYRLADPRIDRQEFEKAFFTWKWAENIKSDKCSPRFMGMICEIVSGINSLANHHVEELFMEKNHEMITEIIAMELECGHDECVSIMHVNMINAVANLL